MADVMKKATRDSYGAALIELAEEYPDLVVLDADLAAATKTGGFKKAYPDPVFRLRHCGEQYDGHRGWTRRRGEKGVCLLVCDVCGRARV